MTHWKRLVALLTIVLATGALAAAGDPPAAAPAATSTNAVVVHVDPADPQDPMVLPLLGVISGPDPCPRSPAPNLTSQLHDIGIVTIRNNDYFDDRLDIEQVFQCPGGTTYPSWEGCDPTNDANYHWEASDSQFESWMDGGFEPFLRLGGENQSHWIHHDFHGPQNAEQESNWIVAATRMADRYLHWTGAEPGFSYLDIWTEWPNRSFWDRSDAAFCSFWTRALQALKARFPYCKIGGPGFLPVVAMDVIQGKPSAAERLLSTLYEAGVRPDWLGWHMFTNDPRKYTEAARAYRQLLDGTGPFSRVPWAGTGFFDHVEMIVDAWMISRLDEAPDGSVVELPLAQYWELANGPTGAAVDTAGWIAMQYTEVARAYYYRCGDPKSSPDGSFGEGASGFFYGDPAGTYKPRAHAVRLWSRVVRDHPLLLQTQVGDGSGPLWALAATDGQGGLALLVANTGDDPVLWQPEFSGASRTFGTLERGWIRQVDGADDGRNPSAFTGWPVEIPPAVVQLVTLGPNGPRSTRPSVRATPQR